MVGLKRLENKKDVFDYIFMDPPYKLGIEEDILTYLSKSNFIDKYTTIIIEANIDRKLDFLAPIGLECIKEKKYKTNKHFFIKMI